MGKIQLPTFYNGRKIIYFLHFFSRIYKKIKYMLREIYNKDPDDPNYKADQIEVTDPLEACIGKIKMLIFTRKGEVLGDSSFGLDLESLVYELNLSEESIKKEIQDNIRAYIPEFYALGGSYNLNFYLGTNRDIATLDFKFKSNSGLSPIVTLLIS